MPDTSPSPTEATPSADNRLQRICVFCGTGEGVNPALKQGATLLGEAMARANIGLVYGASNLGLMGEVAYRVLAGGGHVTGVIPQFLVEHPLVELIDEVQEHIVTRTMHERKQKMFELADAFVALPGGVGTAEEVIEQITWSQLKHHHKPIILANIEGYWEPLVHMFDHMRAEGFVREGLELNYVMVDKAEDIIPTIRKILAAHPEYTRENISLKDL